MTGQLVLTADERATVTGILARSLPSGCRVFVFGSRAGGEVKPWSDLDLSLEGEEPLSLATLAALADAFDEAPLPWKVDLVDRSAVSAEFGAIIDRGKIALI
ncbi:nucleotidyltransferase family protein [Pelagerythrobacter sp.]|uniref:nucleotidyltransferase family protein n=1 Tax=Pelagerythrobacter sp. TaxID=2800702 RepID=UPI0035B3597D